MSQVVSDHYLNIVDSKYKYLYGWCGPCGETFIPGNAPPEVAISPQAGEYERYMAHLLNASAQDKGALRQIGDAYREHVREASEIPYVVVTNPAPTYPYEEGTGDWKRW